MVIEVIEIMASSKTSWEHAAQVAVSEASRSVREIKSVYVNKMSAVVDEGEITDYRVNCKISFAVE
jgi:hypothetical protein